MTTITLRPEDIQEWMRDSWSLYASDTIDGRLLRLWINHLIQYRVVLDNKVLYEGSQMTHAIAAWEKAI